MKKFNPKPKTDDPVAHYALRCTPEHLAQVKAAAEAHGVTVSRFVRSAVEFAMDNIDTPKG